MLITSSKMKITMKQMHWKSDLKKTRLALAGMVFFILFSAGTNGAAQEAPEDLTATIHADQTGKPIPPFMYGMFTELLHNMFEHGIWAEMLSDRKFFYPVDNSEELVPRNTRRHQNRWRPVGPEKNVVMDTDQAYVGKHSPQIILDGTSPIGIKQAGMWLRTGKEYTGRIILYGDPETKVEVSLVWGPGSSERETVVIDHLTGNYMKYPFHFTAGGDTNDGTLEITGTGKGSFHIGAVSLMPADNLHGFRPDLINILKEMNSGIYRLVGGNFVSNYEWRHGIGDPDRRPPRYDYAWNTVESNDVGTDELITMCELIGVEPYLVVNSGFGDAYCAAQWVEYVNGPRESPNGMLRAANGHPEPYGVKYWGIGNEMYGVWQMGHMSAGQYSIKHNFFAEAMLEKDPTIEIIGCGATILEASTVARHDRKKSPSGLPYDFLSPDDWSGTLLSGSYQNIDYLAEHAYPPFNMYFDSEKQEWVQAERTMQEIIRITPGRIKGAVECMKEYEKRIPGLKDKHITLWLDEWISGGDLGTAACLHELFRNTNYISMAGYTGFNGLYAMNDVSSVISSTGQLYRLYRNHLGTVPLKVTGNSPVQPLQGTPLVDIPTTPPGSSTSPLDVFAALNEDQSKLTISVVNPMQTSQQLNIRIEGTNVGNQARVWTLIPPTREQRRNQLENPVKVQESETRFRSPVTVEPMSITLYELEVR